MPDPTHLATWTAYQAAWSNISDRARRELLDRSVVPDCLYTDAQVQCRGVDALVAKIAQSQATTPGVSFKSDQLTDFSGQALSEWTMRAADGAVRVKGASYARFGGDGRLTHMSGFFKRPEDDLASEPSERARNWDLYQAAWARVSADQRRSLLTASVDEAAMYSDPAGQQDGREALIAYIDAVQVKTPGVWFRQTLFVEHHDQAFSRWERLSPNGGPPTRGASFARFTADGRVVQMSGFPGSAPSDA